MSKQFLLLIGVVQYGPDRNLNAPDESIPSDASKTPGERPGIVPRILRKALELRLVGGKQASACAKTQNLRPAQ